jgi:hypothetical protein
LIELISPSLFGCVKIEINWFFKRREQTVKRNKSQ